MTPASKVIEAVAKAYNISEEDITQRLRTKEVAEARQVVAYLLRELNELSFPKIGVILGGRDHTTAMYAYDKISALINESDNFRKWVDAILQSLHSGDEVQYRPPKDIEEKLKVSNIRKAETSLDILNSSIHLTLSANEKDALRDYRRGQTLQEISEKIGLSRERIRQLITKALLKELGSKAKSGYKINIREYIESEKRSHHEARERIPESIRVAILKDIPLVRERKISIDQLSQKHGISTEKLKEGFSALSEIIARDKKEARERWSRSYLKCRGCGTTTWKHVKGGLCEKCVGIFKSKGRENIITRLQGKCSKCGMDRKSAIQKFGRDLYISKSFGNAGSLNLLCRKCFLQVTGSKLADSRRKRLQS